jgi:hypothetical protein
LKARVGVRHPKQQRRLESLLVVTKGGRQSHFDCLRHGPTLQSVPERVRAIVRFKKIQEFGRGRPSTPSSIS